MTNILEELAEEWQELAGKQEWYEEGGDPEAEPLSDDEQQRFNELNRYNDQLGEIFDSTERSRFTMYVKDDDEGKEEYGKQLVADFVEGDWDDVVPAFLRPHITIDYVAVAEEFLCNWALIELDGDDYYVDI